MWSIKSDECLELYQEDEKIAALIWDEVELCWGVMVSNKHISKAFMYWRNGRLREIRH